MALICNSLRIKDVAHLFMDLLAICMSSLEKCLFTYAHFFNQIFFFLGYCVICSLYILVSCFTFKSNPFGVNFREGCEIGSSFTLGNRTTILFNNSTHWYLHKRNLYIHVRNSIYNGQNMEVTQVSINR